MANNIGFGKIYDSTWWGNGVTDNSISWGSIYKDISSGVNPAFNLDFNTIASDFTFTRGSDATFINSNGLIEVSSANTPRIDYGSGEAAFLLEPQSTNLLPYSEDFDNADWGERCIGVASQPVVTSNQAISPAGDLTADRVYLNLNGGNSASDISDIYMTPSWITTGVSYVLSVWLKSADDNNYSVLLDSNGLSPKLVDVTTEWKRFEVVINSLDTIARTVQPVRLRGGSNTSDTADILIWGAQVEQGSYITSYIPTNGSTVTRSNETCNGAGNASTFNDSEGVLFAEISGFVNGGGGDRTISISDGSTQNAIQLLLHNTANRINFRLISGWSLDVNISDFTFEQNQTNKIACKYKSGDYALWINGEEKATSSSSSLPLGLSVLSFDNGSTLDFFGKVKQLQYFDTALTDTELQELTTL